MKNIYKNLTISFSFFTLLLALSLGNQASAQTASITTGDNPACFGVNNPVTISYSGLDGSEPYEIYFGSTIIGVINAPHAGFGTFNFNSNALPVGAAVEIEFIHPNYSGYNAALPYTVNALPPAAPVFVANYSGTYDGAFHLGSVTVDPGQSVVWYTASSGGTETDGLKAVGTATYYAAAKIDATGCFSSTRTSADVTIGAKILTVNVTAQNKAYDGNDGVTLSTASFLGALGGDDVTIGGTVTANFNDKTVDNDKAVTLSGTYTKSGADAGNYSITQPSGLTANITPKELTVNVSANNKVYDGNDGATLSSASFNGVVGGDDVTIGGTVTANFNDKTVANGKSVTLSGSYTKSGTDAGNYNITQPSGLTANITARELTINVTANNKEYNGNTNATLGTASFVGGVGGDDVTMGGSVIASFLDKTVANGKSVTLTGSYTKSGTDAGNYNLTQPSGLTANITAKELTVSVTANNKEYDGNDGATLGSASFVGVAGGDDVTIGGVVTANFNNKTVNNGKAVSLSGVYTKSGADAGNYNITQPSGLTANVTAKELTVSVTANNKVYDGNDDATLNSASFNGIVGGDDVTIGGTVTANFNNKTVANGKAIILTGSYTKSGADAGNYSITQPIGITANVTAKELTVSVTANNKQYDGVTTATLTSASFNGVEIGDDVTIGGTVTANFDNKNVGTGKTVNLSGTYTKSGADANNYSITQPSGLTADITAKNLNISVTAQNKVFDRSDVATLNSASFSNLIGGDDVTLGGTVTANFDNFNIGVAKPVSLTGTYTKSGPDAGNYNLIQPSGLTATITPKTLNITADNQAKCHGAGVTLNGSEFGVSGIISPDEVTSVTLTTSGAASGAAASSTPYSIAPSAAVGSGLSNYDINYINGEFLVRSNPTASFSFNDNTQCFVGHGFNLSNTSSNGSTTGSGTINSWSWTATGSSNAAFTGVGPHGPLTYASHGDYTINLTVADQHGCTHSTNFTNNVRVYQHPTASFTTAETSGTANNDYNICTGATVTFNGTSSSYGFGASSISYQWRKDNTNASGTGSTASIYSPAVNAVSNPDAITYSLRVTDNNGCTSNDFATEPSQVINVYPFASPSLTTPDMGAQGQFGSIGLNGNGGQLICNGAAIFSGSATIPSGTIDAYIFNYGDGSSLESVTDPSLMKHTFPTVTNVPWGTPGEPNVRYTIQMTAVTNQGCSTSTSISRDIKTGPDASVGLTDPSTQSVTNNSFEFLFGNVDQHPSYKTSNLWDFGDGTSTTASYLNITPKIYTTAGNFRAHLIIYTNTGCTDTAHYDVVVTPAPTASFSVTPNSCSNRNVTFNSGASVGAVTYAWNFGDGNTSTLANPIHTYAADGNYTVTLTINTGASSSNQSVAVVTNPVAGTISTNLNTCTNEYTFSSNATGTNLTYAWSFSGGSGSASTTSSAQRTYSTTDPTTVDLTVTANGACSTVVGQLSLNPFAAIPGPNAGLSASLVSACSTSVTITNTSTNADSYEIKVDGGSYSAQTTFPFNIDGLTPGIHTIYIRATDGGLCPDEASTTVTVAPATATFTATPPACGKNVSFQNTSSVSYGSATYAWDFNSAEGTSSSENPTFTFATGGSKGVSLSVISVSGCTSSVSNNVSVSSLVGPTASYTYTSASGCGNGKQFTNTTSGTGLSYLWNFGDHSGTSLENPIKYFGSSGNHLVTLTVSDGVCSSNATQTINISSFSGSAASFVEGNDDYTQVLSGNSFYFENTSTHTNDGWIPNYLWNFGDGTTSTNTHVFGKTYASAGTYTITLTAISNLGCSTTFTRNVIVSAPTSASFSYTPNACGSTSITFNSSASTGATSYSWNFGDGNTSTIANPTHNYATAGTYSVILTINGSIASTPQSVVVSTAPTSVSITPALNACNTTYTFTAAATGSNLTYLWSFSNVNGGSPVSTSAVVNKSYSASGTENATLTAFSGSCSTSVTLSGYSVFATGPLVTANLVITAADACSGTRTINNTGSTATSYQVSVDGGAYASQSTFPYDITGLSAGSHTIALKAINGSCEDIDEATVEIGNVTAGFTPTPSSCNKNVSFLNTTVATYGTPTFAWTFTAASPSASTSTNPSTTYTSSGLNSATLVATLGNGCQSTATNSAINVSSGSGPVPAFTSTFVNSSACSTGYVFNSSTSTGATSYTWNFGDGVMNISTAGTTIFHTYAATGSYTVTLTANNGGCSNSTTNAINVTTIGNQVPDANISLAFGTLATQCVTGNTFYFNNESRVNSPEWMPSHAWNFGDGTTATQTHIHFKKEYASAGTYTVTLTSTSANGCTGTTSMLVTVSPTPCAGLSKNTDPGYYGGDDNVREMPSSTTGIGSNEAASEINLYPNPNNGTFKLSLGNITSKNAQITIVDMLGREVYSDSKTISNQSEITIQDLNLAAGKYNLIFLGSDQQIIHKSFAVVK